MLACLVDVASGPQLLHGEGTRLSPGHVDHSNSLVARWDHLVLIERLDDSRVIYHDTIDIDAVGFTIMVWAWAKWFYRHRQWAPWQSNCSCQKSAFDRPRHDSAGRVGGRT